MEADIYCVGLSLTFLAIKVILFKCDFHFQLSNDNTLSIDPFSFSYPFQGHRGLRPIPAAIGQKAGCTLDTTPACHRAAFTLTFILLGNLESPGEDGY